MPANVTKSVNSSTSTILNSARFEDTPPRTTPSTTRRALGLAHTFRSLRHRNYRLYFFGQLISLMGSWIQTTAMALLAYELTQQSTWTALIAAAQIAPTFILG